MLAKMLHHVILGGLGHAAVKQPKAEVLEGAVLEMQEMLLGGREVAALRFRHDGRRVQADQLGVPIGEVLRSQAQVMRVQRFQRAEQEGARASQKLLVPLVFFIFPAVLIVILGPVILHFISGE